MGRVSDARTRLVDATIALIWTESYAAVSVDAICERSDVKKGSFYHFFKSKDDLILAALESHWQSRKPILDELFTPSVPPLDRLRNYFAYVYTRQIELKTRAGRILGCFYSAVGIGCGRDNAEIAKKVQEILSNYHKYYERALRDAVQIGAQDRGPGGQVQGAVRVHGGRADPGAHPGRSRADPQFVDERLPFSGRDRAAQSGVRLS